MRRLRHCLSAVAIAAAVLVPHTGRSNLRAQQPATSGLAVAPAPAVAPIAGTDHSQFDRLLREHVVAGRVDYDAFERDPQFAQYLKDLDKADLSRLGPEARTAYWLNVYNAFTIDMVVRAHEKESVRNIDKTFGVLRLKGPWRTPIVKAAGRTLSLDDVEHDILRKEFHDPRIHFALAFASVGGAPLRSEAYDGARLNEQLEDQTKRFILMTPDQNHVEAKGRLFRVSPIFMNYRQDFGGGIRAIAKFIAGYYPTGPERAVLERGTFQTQQSRFDWSLNSKLPEKKPAP